jgi:hypothetical protein
LRYLQQHFFSHYLATFCPLPFALCASPYALCAFGRPSPCSKPSRNHPPSPGKNVNFYQVLLSFNKIISENKKIRATDNAPFWRRATDRGCPWTLPFALCALPYAFV